MTYQNEATKTAITMLFTSSNSRNVTVLPLRKRQKKNAKPTGKMPHPPLVATANPALISIENEACKTVETHRYKKAEQGIGRRSNRDMEQGEIGGDNRCCNEGPFFTPENQE